MPSLDFEVEKNEFRVFYNANTTRLQNASRSLVAVISDLLIRNGSLPFSKIESRLKDCEECIKKFNLKYRKELEANSTNYEISNYIRDLVGLRIVCLYEDDIEKIGDILKSEFQVVEVTDKISIIENTEASFGYKGLHFDLKLKKPKLLSTDDNGYEELQFEVQVRTIVQDSWSVLDHKIKYKKSIPNQLKRRINTLAALFELADREFRQIRDATEAEMQKEEYEPAEPTDPTDLPEANEEAASEAQRIERTPTRIAERSSSKLNAFSFLKIASHFFHDFDFEPQKVDGFVHEIVTAYPSISRADFNQYLRKNIGIVKRYQAHLEHSSDSRMNPFTLIRHSLYLDDKVRFQRLLTSLAKRNFDEWLSMPPVVEVNN